MLYLNIKSDELIRVNQHIRVLHLLRLSDKLKISKLSTIKILAFKIGCKSKSVECGIVSIFCSLVQ